jgi:hypothetical protein
MSAVTIVFGRQLKSLLGEALYLQEKCEGSGSGSESPLITAITEAMIIENAMGTPTIMHTRNPTHKEIIMLNSGKL